MIEKNKINIGIDLDNLINKTISSEKFRAVMGFFPSDDNTVFGNNKWQIFLWLHTGGYITEITDLINQAKEDGAESTRTASIEGS